MVTPDVSGCSESCECKAFEDFAASTCNAVAGCTATKVSTNVDDCKSDKCRTEGQRAADCEPTPVETEATPASTPAAPTTWEARAVGAGYAARANTAVKQEGTGGKKLESVDYATDAAFLSACTAGCDAELACGGFVVAPSKVNAGGRTCKPKTRAGVAAGYSKAGKTLFAKLP